MAAINERIAEHVAPHEDLIARLAAIPGISRWTAEMILAEVGPDVTAFPTAQHLASRACLCPGNNISANKRRSGKTRRDQNWVRPALAVYTELGADYFVKRNPEQEQRRAIRKLETLGFTVTLTPVPAAAVVPAPS